MAIFQTTISQLVPASFPVLVLAHFLALISPGPDFFLIVGHAVRHRARAMVFMCAGIALGNAVYIFVAVMGWSLLKTSPRLFTALEFAGAGYLAWMGIMLFRSGMRPASGIHVRGDSVLPVWALFSAGLGSALLNPKNTVFYLTLMTVIIGTNATLAQQAFAGVWMTLAVFFWDAALSVLFAAPKIRSMLSARIPLVEKTAGIVLLATAIAFAVSAWNR